MRTVNIVLIAVCVCLHSPLAALAQHVMTGPPPGIQAIDAHLQQTRAREQREAMNQKSAIPVPPRQAQSDQAGEPEKIPVAAKPGTPQPVRADSKSPRKPVK